MMADSKTTKRMFTQLINIMKQHSTMTISCGEPVMDLLEDVRKLIDDQQEQIAMMKFAYGDQGEIVGELVRCKDCKHSDKTDCAEGFVWCNRNGEGHGTTEDWFCADGEK